jgi:hypothetical protein
MEPNKTTAKLDEVPIPTVPSSDAGTDLLFTNFRSVTTS